MSRFNFSKMTDAADAANLEEIKKLEELINRLGGEIISSVQHSIDAVDLKDSDPTAVQIEKLRKIVTALEPIAAAVRTATGGKSGRRSREDRSKVDRPENKPKDETAKKGGWLSSLLSADE